MTHEPSAFAEFFQQATGNPPYAYQCRLACGPDVGSDSPEALTGTAACRSQLISIPTGLGKTAAVILAWLWNRVAQPDGSARSRWPRRLVYCLPMRTLVEQTRDETRKWIEKLARKNLILGRPPRVVILMGGEELEGDAKDWDIYPEEPAILIGTQDMLLSRALNRGYGMSRYRWPMHFGLLNNDCLWVLDETQLMGVGVETSAQLDAFRHLVEWLRQGPCSTWWMSATLEDSRLGTVDHPAPSTGWPCLRLEQTDRETAKHRLGAIKRLHKAGLTLSKQTKPEHYAKELAKVVLELHVPDQLTLIIVNRVSRAQELYQALQKSGRTKKLSLVHSRFRSSDRQKHQDVLISGTGDRIVVATQAVEAGLDVSARVLITELAPWSSLVQRFGRCNRGGEFNADGAMVHWVNLDFEHADDVAPYTLSELQDARVELEKLEGHSVSPDALGSIQVIPRSVIRPVLRRKDLIDLFDTTPDIAGQDLDISRYVREGVDTDVQVFWGDLSGTDQESHDNIKEPTLDELCRVAVWRFQAFLQKLKKANDGRNAYVWDGLREEWRSETKARTGTVYLLDRRAGGYDPELGWTGELASLKKEGEWTPVAAVQGDRSPDATTKDPLTWAGQALTLSAHTEHVVEQLKAILAPLALASDWHEPLLAAARWHDVGKSHSAFQEMLRTAAGETAPEGILAKSGGRGGSLPRWRRHFRHELASALAWLENHDGVENADLVAYLIAAHHGKVRLSIRSLPEEEPPTGAGDALIARGILDGDELPEIAFDGVTMPRTTLRLELMRMGTDAEGKASWLARMIALRDRLGPFALAYLEALVRAADMSASAAELNRIAES